MPLAQARTVEPERLLCIGCESELIAPRPLSEVVQGGSAHHLRAGARCRGRRGSCPVEASRTPAGPRDNASVREEPARDGTVWISEDADPDEPMLLSGRFSGHLERDKRLREAFDDLEADEAVAWGRARAATVLIRTGDSDYYSAGEHNPDPEAYPVSPPPQIRLERRRPRGFEALDNTERDPPVFWDVRLQVEASNQLEAAAFREEIRSHPAALKVQTPAPGYPVASAALLIETATYNQANRSSQRDSGESPRGVRRDASEERRPYVLRGRRGIPPPTRQVGQAPRNHLLSASGPRGERASRP
jgi:hypothetical protein